MRRLAARAGFVAEFAADPRVEAWTFDVAWELANSAVDMDRGARLTWQLQTPSVEPRLACGRLATWADEVLEFLEDSAGRLALEGLNGSNLMRIVAEIRTVAIELARDTFGGDRREEYTERLGNAVALVLVVQEGMLGALPPGPRGAN